MADAISMVHNMVALPTHDTQLFKISTHGTQLDPFRGQYDRQKTIRESRLAASSFRIDCWIPAAL